MKKCNGTDWKSILFSDHVSSSSASLAVAQGHHAVWQTGSCCASEGFWAAASPFLSLTFDWNTVEMWAGTAVELHPSLPQEQRVPFEPFSANGCYQKSKRHEWLLWRCLGEIQDVFLSYFDRWYWSVCSTRLRDGTPCPYLPIVSGLPLRLIGLRLLKKIYSSSMLPLAEERPVTMSLVL